MDGGRYPCRGSIPLFDTLINKEKKMARITIQIEVPDNEYCFIEDYKKCQYLSNKNFCNIFNIGLYNYIEIQAGVDNDTTKVFKCKECFESRG